MAQRTKSPTQIMSQSKRLENESLASGNSDRKTRIHRIGMRYLNNIARTKQGQRDHRMIIESPTVKETIEAYEQKLNRQYSRRTYMGLSNG